MYTDGRIQEEKEDVPLRQKESFEALPARIPPSRQNPVSALVYNVLCTISYLTDTIGA